MCIKLIQTYACSHQKTICTTPCPHALETGYQILEDDNSGGIWRSNSAVSSIMPSPQRSEQPLQLRSPPSPLSTRSPPSTPSSPDHISRSMSSGLPSPISPFPGHPAHPSPSLATVVDRSHLPSQTGRPAPYSNARSVPGLTPNIPGSSSPTTPTSPPLPLKPVTIEPNYCPYHFPRNLPQSSQPCVECYMLPEWEHLAGRWMKLYRELHHLGKVENVEQESGIEALKEKEKTRREREGLLNVFVHGDEGVGRIV